MAITTPTNGASTGSSVKVTATAGDNVGLASLKLYGDGVQFSQKTCGNKKTCTLTANWSMTTLPSGAHTITAVVTDTAGNTTTSAPVTVNKR